ncbi:MAG TPA: Uma2 family endonuclease [Tepidisphaeraceae bacterium]
MTLAPTILRPFEPGTTGWVADDLNDPHIGAIWEAGHYEIVEGVLALMPPALFDGSAPLFRLATMIQSRMRELKITGDFAPEADYILTPRRVARPDMVLLLSDDLERQGKENALRGKVDAKYGRLLVPPALIVESISQGHEDHDRIVKRNWYAEARVPHYWMLDARIKSLECLKLHGDQYEQEALGSGTQTIHSSLLGGITIALSEVWV